MESKAVLVRVALVVGALFWSAGAGAIEPHMEYRKRVESSQTLTALTDELMGDSVSLYNGATEFTVTDIDLPGNNALPVQLSRRFPIVLSPQGQSTGSIGELEGAGNWNVEVPQISGTYVSGGGGWAPDRCSVGAAPTAAGFQSTEFWQGNTVHIPGAGSRTLLRLTTGVPLPSGGPVRRWTTRERDMVSCIPMQTGTALGGEGFLLETTAGLRYYFDRAYFRHLGFMTRSVGNIVQSVSRTKYYIVASKVEDRFGNTVTYAYNANGNPTSITSSDGRTISLVYSNGRLSTATANGRQWSYAYWTGTYDGMLKSVTLPGTGTEKWEYSFTGTLKPDDGGTWDGGSNASCSIKPPAIPASFGLTVTHPGGATGTFQFHNKRHHRAGIHRSECLQRVADDPAFDTYYYVLNTPNYFDVMSLATKTLTGTALPTRTWTYTYGGSGQPLWGSPGTAAAYPCTTCETEKTVTVANPDNTTREYRYGFLYALNEGRLLGTILKDAAGTIRRVESTTYLGEGSADSQNFFPRYGMIINGDDRSTAAVRPVVAQTIEQDGATFTMAVNTGCGGAGVYCFDIYGNPTRVTRSSTIAPALARTEETTFFHQTAKWILGQVETVRCIAPTATCINSSWPGGKELSKTTYTSAYALPEEEFKFGKRQRTYVWNTATGNSQAGTLKSIADGRGKVTQLSDWFRGIPRLVRYPPTPEAPAGATQSAAVDANGWVTSVTDENGATTGYDHDDMGRLTKVDYPVEDPIFGVTWSDTTHDFAREAGIYGLPAHWRWRTRTGNGYRITRYDAMWRPVIEEAYDNADPANTRTLVVKRYDAAGRLAFQSHPLRTLTNWATVASGTTTAYDALGRVTQTSVPSADPGTTGGAFRTIIDYLTGFRQKVTSPNGHSTTTSFLAWDQPTTDHPVAVVHPEGAFTDIGRDALGKPTAITRRDSTGAVSVTRRMVYRGDTQELCKTIEPETGATVMDYDAAGNLAWSAGGTALTSTGSCNHADVPATARTLRVYDNRNRLETLSFPDGNGDQDWEYRPNGQPSKVTTWNIGSPGADPKETLNVYLYNKRGLLEAETLAVPAWYTFTVDHVYDGNGHVKKTTYPSGNAVNFALNALGQTTALTSSGGTPYASAAVYYPNGALSGYTYGNGIVHTMEQNDRQLPKRSWMRKDGIDYIDDVYAYDGNGNVASIQDMRSGPSAGTRNRTMSYDGLDRLESVVSPMYGTAGATYTYNVLDDLTRVRIGGAASRDHYYCYDASRRLTNIKTAGCGGSTVHGLGYDAQGNLQNKDGQQYRFDFGNRLREVDGVERYRYDAHGRRALAMAFGTGTVLSMYGQDGRLMYQRDERTGKQIDHLYLGGSLVAIRDEPIGGGAGTLRYQHTDALGSPVAVTDQQRNVLETTNYEPYGKVLNRPVHDGPGYTGHVEDAATGLTYMQQRYYDPQIGRFLSTDPIAANAGSMFNRYHYANNNPYRFTDPDGRRACGQDWDCRMAQHNGGVSFSRGELNAAKRNPEGFIKRLNERPNSQRTEQGSGRYFARSAMPVTVATGREVGADIVNMGSGEKPFSVVNFALGEPARGDGSGAVTQGQSYNGPGTRVAIAHTHPINNAFSGWRGCHCYGGWRGGFIRGDLERALSADANAYLATPNGALLRFDLQSMKEDVARSPDAYISASSYFSISP